MDNDLKTAQEPLGISGFCFSDLHKPERLCALHECFQKRVQKNDPELYQRFDAYRQGQISEAPQISKVLVEMASHVSRFIAELFAIESQYAAQMTTTREENDLIFGFREQFVKPVLKRIDPEQDSSKLKQLQRRIQILIDWHRSCYSQPDTLMDDREAQFCRLGFRLRHLQHHSGQSGDQFSLLYQSLRDQGEEDWSSTLQRAGEKQTVMRLLNCLEQWLHAAAPGGPLADAAQAWLIFKTPARVDAKALVPHESHAYPGYSAWLGPSATRRRRDGFALTDQRHSERAVQYEIDHCIYCHERDTDSCSKGMRNKKLGAYASNRLGVTITGCPLEEKISEMHWVKQQGDNIAALALIIIDNPMCPGTGHRICNDCMKGCIYQKTEAVDIPQIETSALTQVLFMPWGFEIYSLLTRWNPLNVQRPYALPYNGKRILVVGMGPAGYTLAHYLSNEGFGVVGIDALKIEPLPPGMLGTDDQPPAPIYDFKTHYEALDQRVMNGFGGVAEYGITVRWDKNFLKVIYLTLARRANFRCYGGVRFGGTLTIEDAWDVGFDHIAMATGSGKPTIIGLRNNLIRGIRKASDFLMSLQLSGAAKDTSLANLQLRLPVGVIGGGLTALDTATEAMAYYPVQVEKILYRYERLQEQYGQTHVRAAYSQEELDILDEFLQHGMQIRHERQRAAQANEAPDFSTLVKQWGGVSLFYRKGIEDSPAYRQNHEEICKALQEGIELVPEMVPESALQDQYGALSAVSFQCLQRSNNDGDTGTKNRIELPMRSLLIAAGTAPNTIYEQEHPYSFRMEKRFFQRYEPDWQNGAVSELVPMHDTPEPKLGKPAPFTSWQQAGRYITFYGDNHPVYAGNVVRAMASAKDGYPYICKLFAKELGALDVTAQGDRDHALMEFYRRLDTQLLATVQEVKRLTPTIVEIIVHAPMQATKFEPGQFYRVQNLEAHALAIENTSLASEGLALTGAWVDKARGLISLITLEMGSSSRLCALWQAGDQINMMGVTGTATQIPGAGTVLLAGGGLGNAVLLSVGKALRAAGNRVLYFAGYKKPEDRFKTETVEAASDVVVWCVDAGTNVTTLSTGRPQDKSYLGNIIDAMEAYAKGELGDVKIPLQDVNHIIAIGSDRMMAAVKAARHTRLKPYLRSSHTAIGSINSPMQCMMKGVCAQCLCRHVCPDTGEEYFVYSCYNQDQALDRVDFAHLDGRLRQNSVLEKLSNLWLDHLLSKLPGSGPVSESHRSSIAE